MEENEGSNQKLENEMEETVVAVLTCATPY